LLRPDQYVWSKHVFEELLDQSQMHHYGDKHLRGYIVDEQHRPADSKRIAAFLKLDKKTTERYLSYLAKVGLIELIEMPSEEQLRSDVESCGHSSTSLNKTGKREIERELGTGKEKKKYPGTGKGKKNDNPNPNGQGQLDLQEQVAQLVNKPETQPEPEPEGDGRTSTSPPTTQRASNPNPDNPTQPDGGRTGLHHDAHDGRSRLEDTVLARNCEGFSASACERLGVPKAADDIGAFSVLWAEIVGMGHSTPHLLELRKKILARADKIRALKVKGKKTYRNLAAGLMSEAKKMAGLPLKQRR
jgi:hypothetical protein